MPTTALSALVFVLVFVPGFCYLATVERDSSESKHASSSAFRETVALVFASATSLLVAAGLFGVLRQCFPRHTPDVGRLVRDGRGYFVADYVYLTWWGLGVLGLACALAFVAGLLNIAQEVDWLPTSSRLAFPSGWYAAFELEAAIDQYKVIHCGLTDGSTVRGTLFSYNPTPDEDDEREIVLAAPIVMELPGGTTSTWEFGSMVLSAARMVWMHVDYVADAEYDAVAMVTAPGGRTSG